MNCTAKAFKYCPKCASGKLQIKGKVLLCLDCSFKYYFNSAAAVAVLITNKQGELLITVRAKEPVKGTLDLPGGFVDPGESVEEGLRREIKEELALDIISMRYMFSVPNIYTYKGVSYNTVDLVYICDVEDASQARPGDDVASILFKSPGEIDPAKFGLESIRKIVEQYIKMRSDN